MFGAYEELYRDYYHSNVPDGPFQAGSRGWSQAPWVTWGDNPNQAGPRRIAANGLGDTEIGTRCACEMKTVGEQRKLVCDCHPHAPLAPPPPFWRSQPHWFFRQYVRDQVAPWGTGPRAFDVPRRRVCPNCAGNREPTSGLGALGATTWNDIPWWCWKNQDGTDNKTFNACKNEATRALPASATDQQRLQAIMQQCFSTCRPQPAGAALPASSSSTTSQVTFPAPAQSSVPAPALPPRSWTSYLPPINTTTLAITALIGIAGVVVAQQKGWL